MLISLVFILGWYLELSSVSGSLPLFRPYLNLFVVVSLVTSVVGWYLGEVNFLVGSYILLVLDISWPALEYGLYLLDLKVERFRKKCVYIITNKTYYHDEKTDSIFNDVPRGDSFDSTEYQRTCYRRTVSANGNSECCSAKSYWFSFHSRGRDKERRNFLLRDQHKGRNAESFKHGIYNKVYRCAEG